MSERQRNTLLRWDNESFVGEFYIHRIDRPFVVAEELRGGGAYRLLVTREQAFDPCAAATCSSRRRPGDDDWALSGIEEVLGVVDQRG